jgi:8-oxo-dGTP pyrophosphatase MutT (NUDIX family)
VTLKDAAVLVPVYRDGDGAIRIVLIRRGERGVHGGQLALPGGKPDPGDASLFETALREANEEIGLSSETVELLESLPVLETRSTGFRIAPYLARIRPPDRWRPAEGEIAEVIEVRVNDLLDPATHDHAVDFPTRSGPQRFPFYRVGPYRLWGATYGILHPLLPRLAAGEWEV